MTTFYARGVIFPQRFMSYCSNKGLGLSAVSANKLQTSGWNNGRSPIGCQVSLGSGTASKWPHFVRVVYTTGGWPLIGHSFLTINNSGITVLQVLVTENQPSLTFTHLWWPSDEHMEKRPIP